MSAPRLFRIVFALTSQKTIFEFTHAHNTPIEERMRLVIEDSQERVAHWVATYVRKRITDFRPTRERPFVLGLPTGSSPLLTYAKLIEFHRAGALSFEHIVTFNMDEYVNLSESHSESYHAFMWTNLFQHVDIRCACVCMRVYMPHA